MIGVFKQERENSKQGKKWIHQGLKRNKMKMKKKKKRSRRFSKSYRTQHCNIFLIV